MLNKTTIALAMALMLGTASAVMANDKEDTGEGGSVMPGSSVGVNPADHRNDPARQVPQALSDRRSQDGPCGAPPRLNADRVIP